MKVNYDKEADAMYIKVKRGKVAKTKEVDSNTLIDYNQKGEPIGIELLFVSELLKSAKATKAKKEVLA